MRRKTRQLKIGNVSVGGDALISVQSMTNTITCDIEKTSAQIRQLEEAGCEIVRVAVHNSRDAGVLGELKKRTSLPIIADIHFDYRLALRAVEQGIDGLRLNPGNIGSIDHISQVVKACASRGLPIRIGINAGSLEEEFREKYGHPTAEGMVESALKHIRILEGLGFFDIKVSLKASNVPLTVKAYKLLAEKVDYPFHLGITEAGTAFSGAIKSAVGFGILLDKGIGDTVRVSLSADPVEEVRVAYEILKSLGLRQFGVSVISCPTCGRAQLDVVRVASQLEEATKNLRKTLTVAVMGCMVNGPGEAREADIAVIGGKGGNVIFYKGQKTALVQDDKVIETLIAIINKEDNNGQR